MKKISPPFVNIIVALLFCAQAHPNGIAISNVSLLSTTNQIQFDITWDNSWRSDVLQNWDAAWMFIKYHDADGSWRHLNLTNSNNVIPAGYTVTIPSGGNGAFVYRSAAGSGLVTLTGVKLGIPANYAFGVYDLKVFGIEMVYIPTAPFWAGDFNTSANSYSFIQGQATPALLDQSYTSVYDPIANTFMTFSLQYPYGYNNFYCMKYEISQGGYRDFLNTLTYSQQVSRTANLPNSAAGTNALTNAGTGRPYIEIATPGVASSVPAVYGCDANNNNVFNEAGDGEWITCNYLSWPDLAAYLSWACLAPMTELQYEKICRGPLQPVAGEYAWGTNQVTANVYTLANAGLTNETVSNPAVNPNEGNAAYSVTNAGINGPVRNGIFATAISNRISSGGSFYGVMEMSGSNWERVITTANSSGRSFTGINGYGVLTSNGNALMQYDYWPGNDGSAGVDGIMNAFGLMFRGGSSFYSAAEMRISNRTAAYVVSSQDNIRYVDQGGRGVRNF